MIGTCGVNYSQQLRVWTEVGNVNLEHWKPVTEFDCYIDYGDTRSPERVIREKNPNATMREWQKLYEEYYNG